MNMMAGSPHDLRGEPAILHIGPAASNRLRRPRRGGRGQAYRSRIQTDVSCGSRPSSVSGADESSTSPSGSETGVAPKFVRFAQPLARR